MSEYQIPAEQSDNSERKFSIEAFVESVRSLMQADVDGMDGSAGFNISEKCQGELANVVAQALSEAPNFYENIMKAARSEYLAIIRRLRSARLGLKAGGSIVGNCSDNVETVSIHWPLIQVKIAGRLAEMLSERTSELDRIQQSERELSRISMAVHRGVFG